MFLISSMIITENVFHEFFEQEQNGTLPAFLRQLWENKTRNDFSNLKLLCRFVPSKFFLSSLRN